MTPIRESEDEITGCLQVSQSTLITACSSCGASIRAYMYCEIEAWKRPTMGGLVGLANDISDLTTASHDIYLQLAHGLAPCVLVNTKCIERNWHRISSKGTPKESKYAKWMIYECTFYYLLRHHFKNFNGPLWVRILSRLEKSWSWRARHVKDLLRLASFSWIIRDSSTAPIRSDT